MDAVNCTGVVSKSNGKDTGVQKPQNEKKKTTPTQTFFFSLFHFNT